MNNYSKDELVFLASLRNFIDCYTVNDSNNHLVNKYKESVNAELIGEIDNYVDFVIRKKFPSYANQDYNDIKNEVIAEILKALPKYNGTASLSTYLNPYILAGVTKEICYRTNRTLQQNRNIIKIERAKIELMKEGYKEEEITYQMLSDLTGMSVDSIIDSYRFQIRISLDSLDDTI